MRKISSQLKEHLAQPVTTLATCWHLKLRNGKELGFTEHDHDIVIQNVTYLASSGITASAIMSNSNMAVDNLELEGILDNELIREDDLCSGLYDHAEVQVFLVNYRAIQDGILSIQKGWLGEVRLGHGYFVAEVRGLTQALTGTIGKLYSPRCRAIFCDLRCSLKHENYTYYGTITKVETDMIFYDEGRKEEYGFFNYGSISFHSGSNQGQILEVRTSHITRILLALPLPYPCQIGDQYSITTGCDKTLTMCSKVYNNALNFRGEPHIPGMSKLLLPDVLTAL